MNKKLLISAIATGCLIATSCIQANTDSNMLQSEMGNFNKVVAGSNHITPGILNSRAEYTIKDKGYELFMTFSDNLNSAAFYVLSYTGTGSAAISNHYTLPPLTNTAGDTKTPVIAEVSASNDTAYLATGWEHYSSDDRDYTYGLYTAKINSDGSLDQWTPATTLPISPDAFKADKAYPIWFGTMPSNTGSSSSVKTVIFIRQEGEGKKPKAHYLVYQQTDGKWQLKKDFATTQGFAYPNDGYSAINQPPHLVQNTSTHQNALLILSKPALFSFVFNQDGTFQKALSVGLPSSDKTPLLKNLYSENWNSANGDMYLTDQNHGVYHTAADSVFSASTPNWQQDAAPQDGGKNYSYDFAAPAPNSPTPTGLNVVRSATDVIFSQALNCIPPQSGTAWLCIPYLNTNVSSYPRGEFLNIGQQTYMVEGSDVYQYSRTSN